MSLSLLFNNFAPVYLKLITRLPTCLDKDLNVESMDNAASTVTANSKVAYSKIVQAYLLEDYYYVVVKISQIACRN